MHRKQKYKKKNSKKHWIYDLVLAVLLAVSVALTAKHSHNVFQVIDIYK